MGGAGGFHQFGSRHKQARQTLDGLTKREVGRGFENAVEIRPRRGGVRQDSMDDAVPIADHGGGERGGQSAEIVGEGHGHAFQEQPMRPSRRARYPDRSWQTWRSLRRGVAKSAVSRERYDGFTKRLKTRRHRPGVGCGRRST